MELSWLFIVYVCWDIDECLILDKLKFDVICYMGEIGLWW